MRRWAAILVLVGGITVVGLAIWQALRPDPAPTPPTTTSSDELSGDGASAPASTHTRLYTADVDGVTEAFRFSLEIPTGWQAEAVSAIEAINVYDPAATGESNLEKSQLFIRHFEANAFLTLQTVTIHEQSDLSLDGRPARHYVIEKNTGVADFLSQPSWRNAKHTVTDVRVRDDNPSTFYVIAQRPDLPDNTHQRILDSLKVVDEPPTAQAFIEPVAEFRSRITKKSFGTYVTPESSPVSPERFTGYHTGVDVEYGDVADEVPIRAIADGTVVLAKAAQGYGGVTVLTHTIDGTVRAVLYGHLDPAALPAVGATVTRGQEIGRLGDGRSDETGGERKHLHFAIRRDATLILLGYIQRDADLTNWLDPLTLSYSSS